MMKQIRNIAGDSFPFIPYIVTLFTGTVTLNIPLL